MNERINVLEPTGIVHIDGQPYQLTDRKAGVGEKIFTTQTQFGRLPVGKVLTVTDVFDNGSIGEIGVGIVEQTDYRLLVPLDQCEKTFENKNSEYKEIINLIHNDLGITRQDIQEMISVAVSNEVQKLFESGKLDIIVGAKIDSLIEEGFRDGGRLLSETVLDEVGKHIASVLHIKVEVRGDH